MKSPTESEPHHPSTYLIGAGVVGRSILRTHLAAAVSVQLCDLDRQALQRAIDECRQGFPHFQISWQPELGGKLPMVQIRCPPKDAAAQSAELSAKPIAIESVVERRDVKQRLLAELQSWLGGQTTICSNTSTLPIQGLSEGMKDRSRCCGMHFFMPVEQRPLVEIVVPQEAAAETVQQACQHAERLGKPTLRVADAPGFVVNRLLAPYLNEAMRLLQRGASPSLIERCAVEFGMPMSPLELIDLIGARTAFDSGRVYWQAFPQRIDPTAILPAMIKAKRTGAAVGAGFFDYDLTQAPRSSELAAATRTLIEKYSIEARNWTANEILQRLTIPMLIEATAVLADGVVTSIEDIELAMRGGLGFRGEGGFRTAFDRMGSGKILETLRNRRSDDRALSGCQSLIDALQRGRSVREAIGSCCS